MDRIRASAAAVERIVAGGETVYGINTGFGLLANTRIPPERLAELQRNLILSHSCGLGDALPRHVVRLMIVLKLFGLGRGYSGVRPLVIDALQALLDQDAMPLSPRRAASARLGDLAPLAHLIAALIGQGRIDLKGENPPAGDALDKLGMAPLELGPKEGLALINGTQASTAIALDALFMAERVFGAALRRRRAFGRCAQGLDQAVRPAHQRSSRPARPDPRRRRNPRPARRQRDPRQPRALRQGAGSLQLPLPAAGDGRFARPSRRCRADADNRSGRGDRQSDRFRGRGYAISGGNFHAQPVAFAADMIAMALCEVGSSRSAAPRPDRPRR